MKNLVCVFCSVRPDQLPENTCDFRELEYSICLDQLIGLLPKNFDIVICENTLKNADSIKSENLKNIFANNNSIFLDQNILFPIFII